MQTNLTPAQRERQHRRDGRSGQYIAVPACELCARSAGIDYYSDRRVDTGFGGFGLVLCGKCCNLLDGLTDETALAALRYARAARSAGQARPYNSRGRFYAERVADAWQVVDRTQGMTIAAASKQDADEIRRGASAYVDLWGDIDFTRFPMTLDEPFQGEDTDELQVT